MKLKLPGKPKAKLPKKRKAPDLDEENEKPVPKRRRAAPKAPLSKANSRMKALLEENDSRAEARGSPQVWAEVNDFLLAFEDALLT